MSCSCDNNPLILPVGATGPQGPKGDPGFGFEHYIGEEFGGGVVFHVYKDTNEEEHGLIVDTTNLAFNTQIWSNIDNVLIGTSAQSSFDGLFNSIAITGQSGQSNSGAKLCIDSTNNSQNDWYLPSIDELSLLFQNRFNVNKTISTIVGATQLSVNTVYFSSTELNDFSVWCFDFYYGHTDTTPKSDTQSIRAIRKF